MLEALIPSRTRVKLLTLFLLNPENEYYLREIVRRTDENYNSVRRELANLKSFGLITGQRKGNQQYDMVNRDFFLYDELQKVVLKTEGVVKIIKEDLASFSVVECMFIFGSFAQGTAGSKSDIDLFIVGDVDENTLIPLIHKSELVIKREINYVLMHSDEFRKRMKAKDPFVTNVMKEPKIMITGACDD